MFLALLVLLFVSCVVAVLCLFSAICLVVFVSLVLVSNKKMSVYKLMTAQEDKETLRSIMSDHNNLEHQVQYICSSEYYSLNDEDKTKIVATQLDFMNKTR